MIDDLFYQEDEIGEMRHTAFMIECGLDEDPPDGPDVPPVPWGDMLLKQQQLKAQNQNIAADENVVVKGGVDGHINNSDDSNSNGNSNDKGIGEIKSGNRSLPNRSRSTDDIDTLAIELTSSQKMLQKTRTAPNRTSSSPSMDAHNLVDGKFSPSSSYVQFSPSSLTKRNVEPRRNGVEIIRPEKRTPKKTPSDDDVKEMGLSTSLTKTERTRRTPESRSNRHTPQRGKLTATRSGTCHEMAVAAARAKAKLSAEKSEKNGKNTGPAKRNLTKTRSGTCHEMAAAAVRAKEKLNAEKSKKNFQSLVHPSSPSVLQRKKSFESLSLKNSEKYGRPEPARRKLVATKSGTLHGMRKNGRNKEKSNTGDNNNDNTEDDENETSRIVIKNGKRMNIRRNSSITKSPKASRSKLKSNNSGHDRKTDKVVYRNGKKEIIKQHNSSSDDNSGSDHEFLGDLISNSDDKSVASSEISVSTSGSEFVERYLSPRKEQKAFVPKSIEQSLRAPVRKQSLTRREIVHEPPVRKKSLTRREIIHEHEPRVRKKSPTRREIVHKAPVRKKSLTMEIVDDDASYTIKPTSSKSIKSASSKSIKDISSKSIEKDATKKKKKKKKKKQSDGLGDDAKDIPDDSISSRKKKKKKEKKEKEKEKEKESIDDDTKDLLHDSFSSQMSTSFRRKKQNEAIYGAVMPGCFPSPSSVKSKQRKSFDGSPPFIEIERSQGQTSKPDEFLIGMSPSSIHNRTRDKLATQRVKPLRQLERPGDWLGSGKTQKRTWRVKTKTNVDPPEAPAENSEKK